jgi:hypothetical protein
MKACCACGVAVQPSATSCVHASFSLAFNGDLPPMRKVYPQPVADVPCTLYLAGKGIHAILFHITIFSGLLDQGRTGLCPAPPDPRRGKTPLSTWHHPRTCPNSLAVRISTTTVASASSFSTITAKQAAIPFTPHPVPTRVPRRHSEGDSQVAALSDLFDTFPPQLVI